MTDYSQLIKANQTRWDTAVYEGVRLLQASDVAKRLVADTPKSVYIQLQGATKVPWWVVAVIHEREASQDFRKSLAQGDPWNAVSTHEPAGRGPFTSFVAAGIDALTNCHPYAAKWTDWSAGGALTLLELYNGLGYEKYHNMASPYLWAGTQHYVMGKYTADGHFDPTVVDSQLGCAIMIHCMLVVDPTITFGST